MSTGRRGRDRRLVERDLTEAGRRITRAHEELTALDEQVAWFDAAAEEARVRALVTESKVDERELSEAERHSQAIRRSREDLVAHIERLKGLQEELLEELPGQAPGTAQTDERVF